MRLFGLAAAAAPIGLTAAGVIQARTSEETCSNLISTGEVLHLSLNIVEYPIVVDVQLEQNTVVTVDKTILIACTNAPTRLHTTVHAISTETVTRTISTATVTATGEVVSSATDTATAGNDRGRTVTTKLGTNTAGSNPEQTATDSTGSIAPVAGGNAVGSGINTNLYTASTSNTAVHTVTSTAYHRGSSMVKTYTTTIASAIPTATLATGVYTDWTKFKANGVNLGGWLEQEKVFDQYWWDQYAPDADDEWTFCETLGDQCGPVLEQRYASYITTDDIDKVAAVGVNTLRIPTTYAAWIQFPGSALYHGNQKEYLKKIATYAIEKYNMRIVVGLHSLPGGVNSLDIGEKAGNDGWFQNYTNLAWSYKAVDQVLDFFASDNPSAFASPNTLTTNGTNWILKYTSGVLARVARVDKRIPVMLQDCFLGEEHCGTNLVIDTHVYYFAASGVYSQWANGAICGQASVVGGDGKFPVYIGEWALQTLYSNTFRNRKNLFNTQRYAWSYFAQGGSFWNIKHNSSAAVDGQGTQRDYWSYERLIDAGVINQPVSNATYC
ncbi:uncharacterized protein N7477_010137 [Penicillium maclennaniae]|uniref:uncharacterized protein n=1 Tax=Penicillium maclennaniae TaxID=1343394 RepID=UPI0025418D68|nr:uncharacterized protein N7477_010137 [Penicillium maclennaniae]KAJ5662521.1 hypothetical protein N7477_010137 [Penicillium maclennaniae]